jgi:DNA circularisation protein N-terminus
MPWQDRLLAASYRAPSGNEIEFLFEDLSETFEKHTAAFDFPDADGTYVQDRGRSGRRFPMRIYFEGDDYDLDAAIFSGLLGERGVGSLTHPVYGVFPVVPFGRVARRDALKTAANQAVFEVEFFQTNELLFPVAGQAPGDEVQEALDAFRDVAPVEFEETLDTDTTVEAITLRNRYAALVALVEGGLATVVSVEAEVKNRFNQVATAINDAIDVFVSDPLAVAFQTNILISLPARVTETITARLEAYGNLLDQIISTPPRVPGLDSEPNNNFRADDLFAANVVMGSVSAVLVGDFETRVGALEAAETVLDQCAAWSDWRDANLQSLGAIDAGSVYQQVLRGCQIAAGFLVEISFTLKQERSLELEKARTPIDLAAQLYGSVDNDMLDFLINSNGLVGQDILEVPRGREIVYYV